MGAEKTDFNYGEAGFEIKYIVFRKFRRSC